MRIGIQIHKDKMDSFLKLFNWNESEEIQLDSLTLHNAKQYLDTKMYKHMLSLFELAYSLAIDPAKHVGTEPACAWQIGG